MRKYQQNKYILILITVLVCLIYQPRPSLHLPPSVGKLTWDEVGKFASEWTPELCIFGKDEIAIGATEFYRRKITFPDYSTQIPRLEWLEICTKMPRNLSENFGAKFPSTTLGYSEVRISRLNDDFSDVCWLCFLVPRHQTPSRQIVYNTIQHLATSK